MADTDAARIGDVKAGFAAAKQDANARLRRDGTNVNMTPEQSAAFRSAIGVGGGGSGDVVGPSSVSGERLSAFDGPTGKLLKAGPTYGDLSPLSLLYRVQAQAEFQAQGAGLTALAGLTDPGLYHLSAPDAWSKVTIGSGLTFSGGVLAASGGSGGGNVVGPATVSAGRLAAFNGTNGREITQGPAFGEAGALSLVYRAQVEAEFQAKSAGLTSLAEAATGNIFYKADADAWSPVSIGTGLSFVSGVLSATGGGGGGPSLSNTAPPALGTAAAGSSAEAARGDHVHAHGSQAGGTLHAAATTAANGFMSAADKAKLDGVATGATANSPNATLLNRANHTGTQTISTLSDLPTITTNITNNSIVQRDSSGWAFAARFACNGGHYYFNTGATVWIRYTDPNIVFSNSATGPAFTPTSDPRLKRDMVKVTDDALSLARVSGIHQWTYTRTQDEVYAAGGNAYELRELNPLYVVGGVPVPEEEADDRGAVQNADGSWETPLAVDIMAIITDQSAAIRELERRLAALES